MKLGFQLAKHLKSLNVDAATARESRALFVAQMLGYQCPLSTACPVEECLQRCEPAVMAVINDVNEVIHVDTTLTRSLFRKIVKARHELMTGVSNPLLVQTLLKDDERLHQRLSEDQQTALSEWVAHPDFMSHQQALHQTVWDVFNADTDDAT